MADDTGDGAPTPSSSPPPPARRTRRSAANTGTHDVAKRKPGPKPGSTRRSRQPAPSSAGTVAEAVAPKVRKAKRAVEASAEAVKRKAPQVKARAKKAVKAGAAKAERSSPLRKGLALGAIAAAASVVAGIVTLGRAKKTEDKAPPKPVEHKAPTHSAD